jgi:putative transposase
VVTAAQRRTVVTHLGETAALSERRACRSTDFARASQRYHTQRAPDTELRATLHELAARRPRWGYREFARVLRRRPRPRINRKRVQRVYQEEGLQVRRRRRKRSASVPRAPAAITTRANERWGMDFVRDTLGDGRAFRALTIVDNCTRECSAIEVAFSLPWGARRPSAGSPGGHPRRTPGDCL